MLLAIKNQSKSISHVRNELYRHDLTLCEVVRYLRVECAK